MQTRKSIDNSWDGGKKGFELFLEFILQAKPFINFNQKFYIYFISSSVSKFQDINERLEKSGFKNTTLKKKHIFFEDIILNRLEKI